MRPAAPYQGRADRAGNQTWSCSCISDRCITFTGRSLGYSVQREESFLGWKEGMEGTIGVWRRTGTSMKSLRSLLPSWGMMDQRCEHSLGCAGSQRALSGPPAHTQSFGKSLPRLARSALPVPSCSNPRAGKALLPGRLQCSSPAREAVLCCLPHPLPGPEPSAPAPSHRCWSLLQPWQWEFQQGMLLLVQRAAGKASVCSGV